MCGRRRRHLVGLTTRRRLRLRRLLLLLLLFLVLFVFPVEEISAAAVGRLGGFRPLDDRHHYGGRLMAVVVVDTLLLLLLLLLLQMISFFGYARQRRVTDRDDVGREHFADLRRRRLFVFTGRRRHDGVRSLPGVVAVVQ